MSFPRSNLMRLPAWLAAIALVLVAWTPADACSCSPCGAALEGCGSGCCVGQSLCQSCCDRSGTEAPATDCLADGGCLCHPVSAPTPEQPRIPQADQAAQPLAPLPGDFALLPAPPALLPPLAAAAPVSSGAEIRVLYCSRLE